MFGFFKIKKQVEYPIVNIVVANQGADGMLEKVMREVSEQNMIVAIALVTLNVCHIDVQNLHKNKETRCLSSNTNHDILMLTLFYYYLELQEKSMIGEYDEYDYRFDDYDDYLEHEEKIRELLIQPRHFVLNLYYKYYDKEGVTNFLRRNSSFIFNNKVPHQDEFCQRLRMCYGMDCFFDSPDLLGLKKDLMLVALSNIHYTTVATAYIGIMDKVFEQFDYFYE